MSYSRFDLSSHHPLKKSYVRRLAPVRPREYSPLSFHRASRDGGGAPRATEIRERDRTLDRPARTMDHGPIDPDPAEEEEASSRGVGLGWDEGSMRNVEAGLGRGEGGLGWDDRVRPGLG